ncbi:MAG: hypothetical protein Q7T51_01620 [Candidatus Moranbacteria bacterium]|nr:hypothetical protein [Candidatus Moranbacteria bacterium]
MENNNKKEITLEAIAELIKAGNNETVKVLEAKIESAVDNLAIITNNNFVKLEADIKAVKSELDIVKSDLGVVKNDLDVVKSDVEEIKTNINKKVDVFTHKDLEFRVEKVEEKTGIAKLKAAIV